jgi:hydrogenase-4 component E
VTPLVSFVDLLMIVVVLTNLTLLGSSRLAHAVRIVALQGVVLGVLLLAVHSDHLELRVVALAVAAGSIKGLVFPWFLRKALRDSVRREAAPFVGYSVSMLLGIALLGVAFWLGGRLPLPHADGDSLVVPVALSTLLTGLQLLVSRRTLLNQVLGYLVFENGIFAFGLAVVRDAPLLFEMGVLLDVFVAVFVMGLTVFHIQRELEHIDADRLSTLKDWTP